jgi:hypothetical protein
MEVQKRVQVQVRCTWGRTLVKGVYQCQTGCIEGYCNQWRVLEETSDLIGCLFSHFETLIEQVTFSLQYQV